MKRALTIHIDANRVTCGKCDELAWLPDWDVYECRLFAKTLRGSTEGINRCAPCLAAEKGAT